MGILLDKLELARIIENTNPWWNARPDVVPNFRRLAFRTCFDLLQDRSQRRAVLLSGPRRVGKSVILKQIAHALLAEGAPPRSVLYVSFEQSLLKLVPLRQVLDVYRESFHPAGEPAFLLLDEIHYSPEWDVEIKVLVDQRPEYRILATGSATNATRGQQESGVGRWRTVKIPTLSFYEYLRLRNKEIGVAPGEVSLHELRSVSDAGRIEIASRTTHLMPEFDRYMLMGGFPETAQLESVAEAQRLLHDDVVDRVLKRDMTTLFGVRSVPELERLFIYLCYHTGAIMQVRQCATDLGVNRQTVQNFLDLLEMANLIYRLPPDSHGGKLALKGSSKYYTVDAALRNAVLLKGEEVLRDATELGRVVETTILRHVYAYHYDRLPRLAYWRDSKTNREVDIVVRLGDFVVPFEVKYREYPLKDGIAPLASFCHENPGVSRAYFVTRREVDFGRILNFPAKAEVFQIPAHIFCLALGSFEHGSA